MSKSNVWQLIWHFAIDWFDIWFDWRKPKNGQKEKNEEEKKVLYKKDKKTERDDYICKLKKKGQDILWVYVIF